MLNLRKTLAIPGMLFLLFQPFAAVAQSTQSPPEWGYPGPWHMMWGGGGFWWIFPLFMLFVIVMCFLFMMRGPWMRGHHLGSDATTSALQILNERFAKGEIKREEYEEKKSAILRRT
jgi:putative membrane protein